MKFSRNVKKFEYAGRYAGDGKSYEFYWDDYKAIVWSGHFDGYAFYTSATTFDINEALSWIGQKPVEDDEIVEKIMACSIHGCK